MSKEMGAPNAGTPAHTPSKDASFGRKNSLKALPKTLQNNDPKNTK